MSLRGLQTFVSIVKVEVASYEGCCNPRASGIVVVGRVCESRFLAG